MKLELASIKNIIFDLGGVILNLDLEGSIQKFRKLGLKNDIINDKQIFSDEVFNLYQSGIISSAEFREKIRNLLNNKDVSDEEINDAWGAMIVDIPPKRVEVLQKLSERFSVYLYSNTNDIHIRKLYQEFKAEYGFNFDSLFDKVYYSHEINDAKPNVSSYQKVIEDSGVNPTETLFVDDLKRNIWGAEAAGLKGFWLQPGIEISEVFKDFIQ